MSDQAQDMLDQDQVGGESQDTKSTLEQEYQVDTADIVKSESLVFVILDLTVNQLYDKAIRQLESYLEFKADYPTYRERTEKLFLHIISVIKAIKTKKTITQSTNLPASKRREMAQAIAYHFRELKKSLQNLNQIEFQLKQRDSRSTLIVVKAFMLSVAGIATFTLAREIHQSMQMPLQLLQRDLLRMIYNLIGI